MIYASYTGASEYIKQILMAIKGEIDSNTIKVETLISPLTSMDKSSRLKINEEIMALSVTLDEIDLKDINVIKHFNKCYEGKYKLPQIL